MAVNPSDRIQPIKASEMLLPATCMVCGRGGQHAPERGVYNANNEVFVDLNVFHEWDHIQCYLCRDCAHSVGAVYDMVPADKAKTLVLENVEFAKTNDKLRTRIMELENVVDGLTRERLASRDFITHTASVPTGSDGNPVLIDESQTTESDNQRVTDIEPELTEPTESTGRTDVTSDASDDGTEHGAGGDNILAELGL